MRHLNTNIFREIDDLQNQLYLREPERITGDQVAGWVRDRNNEFINSVQSICKLVDRLNASWGARGQEGNAKEIHHCCLLIQKSLLYALDVEERIRFCELPKEYEEVSKLLTGILGRQFTKLEKIPEKLDEIVSLSIELEEQGDSTHRTINHTITFDLPPNWDKKITKALKIGQRRLSDEPTDLGCFGWLIIVGVAFLLIQAF